MRTNFFAAFVLIAALVVSSACEFSGPTGPTPPGPPPPPVSSGVQRLVDPDGNELPMTVRLIMAQYVTGQRSGFQFAIEACVEPYNFPIAYPHSVSLNQGMTIRFYPSRDGVGASGGMGSTRVPNPWPGTEKSCVIYDSSNSVTLISREDVQYIINWGTYGYSFRDHYDPADPKGGTTVFDVRQ